jgi:hypothetical protein
VWRHRETGEHIHLGHICADKYGLLVDYSTFELDYARFKRARAVEIKKAKNKAERSEFLSAHPGLAEALETDHNIVQDIATRFQRSCWLSDKQIELVFKIKEQVDNPQPEETYVPAPTGRQEFEGTVVGTKFQDGMYGVSYKMTVKMETDKGVWLAFGTVPSRILDSIIGESLSALKGKKVLVKGTLTQSDKDAHFAFFKRPSGVVKELG